MDQTIILARQFVFEQDNSPIRIKKRHWVKKYNYSTQTLYEGLRKLSKEMDVSKYISNKRNDENDNLSFRDADTLKNNPQINSVKKNLLHDLKNSTCETMSNIVSMENNNTKYDMKKIYEAANF